MMRVEYVLTGPRGDNPLGFLTALGALLALKDIGIEAGLSWDGMTPTLWGDMALETPGEDSGGGDKEDKLIAVIHESMKREVRGSTSNSGESDPDVDDPILGIREKNLGFSNERLLNLTEEVLLEAHYQDRRCADLLAAYGIQGSKIEKDSSIKMLPSPWVLLNGQGGQKFLKTVRNLVAKCEREHFRRALFGPWLGNDEKNSLRLDPSEDRRYALMDGNPSYRSPRTLWGANRLAFEALRFFPAFKSGGESGGRELGAVSWNVRLDSSRWPLWRYPIDGNVIGSLLSHSDIWKDDDAQARSNLQGMGVFTVIESRKLLKVDKYKNLTHGVPLWFAS